MPSVAILVPVVGRPHRAAPFMESFRASGAQDTTVYAVAERDDPDSIDAWQAAGAQVLSDHDGRTFAEKVNLAFNATEEDWIFIVGDDVRFHEGWLEAAWGAPLAPKVIGIRDSDEPDPKEKAGHLLMERAYIATQGASWDGPGIVCHPYVHYYVDDEILSVARRRGVYFYSSDAYVEHLHPNNHKAPEDEIYRRGWEAARTDWIEWLKRRAANMKVAVYGLALNEETNVAAWAASIKDADYVLLADTGSTDRTVEVARSLGVEVIELAISPFRFDDAQNAAISALPREVDWCISLDLDERLQPGWRDGLLLAADEATRVGMWFVWEKELDQMPEGDHWHEDCHRRTGYRWRGIIHEELYSYGYRSERKVHLKQIQINHVPDRDKPRAGKYLDMIRMSLLENPKAARMSQWLVWQLDQEGRKEEAATELKRYIKEIVTWPPAIADAMHRLSQCEPDKELYWLEQAEKTVPTFRSHKARLALYYYRREDWESTLYWANAALAIQNMSDGVYDEGFGWTATIFEFKYMALFNMGQISEALKMAELALKVSPQDERIARNITIIKSNLEEVNG